MMKWSGVCVALSGALLLACALGEVAVGLRCLTLGSAVRTHFRLSGTAGAFYSGLVVGGGQLLLGLALLCCSAPASAQTHGCRNLALLAVVVLLLGILTAFSGAVLDGDTATLVQRKYSHFCHEGQVTSEQPELPVCARLREYQRCLVLSTLLSALQVALGLLHLLLLKRHKAKQCTRRRLAREHARQSAHEALFPEERDTDLPHVSYINLALSEHEEPPRSEAPRCGHPSHELPGYAPPDHYILVSAAPPVDHRDLRDLRDHPDLPQGLPRDLPPAYDDIFPGPDCPGPTVAPGPEQP